jgi:DNA invertase Pin-like site-specific DNA recombinase
MVSMTTTFAKPIAAKSLRKPVTALYLRISLDDDNQDISNSITNQQDLLSAYVAADPILSASEVLTFADDGWSGTSFERPHAKALLDMVKRGEVQTIIVKDISRWGRNYIEVSEYLDQIFPFLGVRFISVNDQYDSADHKGQTAPMGVAFSSIVHGIYSKELSVKVSQAQRVKAKKGEYVHGTNFYGYVRCKEKKNHLIVDEVAAAIVQRIFDMACEGMSTNQIAATLNADGVDSPLTHRIQSGHSTHGIKPLGEKSFWRSDRILRMLKDERYTGTMVSHKHKASSPGSKQRILLPKDEWVKAPNAHEAIISTEQFAKAQANLRKNKNVAGGTVANRPLFAGKIFCGHCQRAMAYKKTKNSHYRCANFKLNTGQGCYEGKVFVDNLAEIVLVTAKLEAQKALDLKEAQRLQRQKQTQDHSLSEKSVILADLKKLTTSVTLLEQHSMALYEKFTVGEVDRETYISAKAKNNAGLENSQTRIAELNQRLATIEEANASQATPNNEAILNRILTANEATEEVFALLDRVVVYDDEHIEIWFKFMDSLSAISNHKLS